VQHLHNTMKVYYKAHKEKHSSATKVIIRSTQEKL